MNLGGFDFLAYCKECKETRSVSCSQTEARKGGSILVGAIVCGHAWLLNSEQSDKVRKLLATAA
jgi:hypothetical protein